jgi:hypothetical protein
MLGVLFAQNQQMPEIFIPRLSANWIAHNELVSTALANVAY